MLGFKDPVRQDLDKLEMIMQAGEYERAQNRDLGDFFNSTAGKFKTEVGQSWEAEIVKRREVVEGGGGKRKHLEPHGEP